MKTYKTVGEYAKELPAEARREFEALWRVIREMVPEGEETIRYGVPTIRIAGRNVVHLAAAKNHLGFYPTPSGVRAFEEEIRGKYAYSKGTIQFPLGKKPPLGLVRRIVRFRLSEERAKKNGRHASMDKKAAPVTQRIYARALELLAAHPEGMRWADLLAEIRASDRSFHPKTVNGCIWKLVERFPDQVYKPSKGLFCLLKYKNKK